MGVCACRCVYEQAGSRRANGLRLVGYDIRRHHPACPAISIPLSRDAAAPLPTPMVTTPACNFPYLVPQCDCA